jgi:hypothetical protein
MHVFRTQFPGILLGMLAHATAAWPHESRPAYLEIKEAAA